MLNGKFRCVKDSGSYLKAMTEGNIYEFKDGAAKLDSGIVSNRYESLAKFHSSNLKYKLEPIELPQPHKSLLKSGDKVVYRDKYVRFVLLETQTLHDFDGIYANELKNFTSDLKGVKGAFCDDIMEIWRGDELIAKRIEKPAKEIEIERIENEMRKLADDLRKVKGE